MKLNSHFPVIPSWSHLVSATRQLDWLAGTLFEVWIENGQINKVRNGEITTENTCIKYKRDGEMQIAIRSGNNSANITTGIVLLDSNSRPIHTERILKNAENALSVGWQNVRGIRRLVMPCVVRFRRVRQSTHIRFQNSFSVLRPSDCSGAIIVANCILRRLFISITLSLYVVNNEDHTKSAISAHPVPSVTLQNQPNLLQTGIPKTPNQCCHFKISTPSKSNDGIVDGNAARPLVGVGGKLFI